MTSLREMLQLRRKREPMPEPASLAPDRPLYVVGDIHGRADLLTEIRRRVAQDRADQGAGPGDLVFVGDYIDRGPASAEVLATLRELDTAPEVTCLMGNHERMMLDFLDDPAGAGPHWLANGGVATLGSFGIPVGAEHGGAGDIETLAAQLAAALADGTEAWVRARPLSFQSGNVAVVHAGAEPATPIGAQAESVLLWDRSEIERGPRPDGVWVVHGHTIFESPVVEPGRIALDTGACITGRLTAAAIGADRLAFLAT